MDFSNVEVQEDNIEAEGELSGLTNSESPKALPAIWSEVSTRLFMISHSLNQFDFRNYKHFVLQVMRFLTNPHKPMILALSRPDPKKNITTLVKAFGECRLLQELANLVSTEIKFNKKRHLVFCYASIVTKNTAKFLTNALLYRLL